MYVDQIIFTPTDCEAEKFLVTVRDASHGSVTSDVAEAEEGQTVTLTIKADEGYGLESLKVVNGVNFTMANTVSLETLTDGNTKLTFTMPDDMVTLQPVFAKGQNVVGIRLVDADGSDTGYVFDLNGRRVTNPSRGVFIKNGKKYIVK